MNATSPVVARRDTSPPQGPNRDTLWTSLAIVGLLACYFVLGLTASRQNSLTGDEGAHLAGGFSYWAFHDYRLLSNNGNWPQRLCGLPLWLSGYQFPSTDLPAWRQLQPWDVGHQFIYECGNDADAMMLRSRAMTAILGVTLGLLIYFWSQSLFGRRGGLLSLALFAFSPTMLTHGFLVTTDMANAVCFTAAVGALWMLLNRVSVITVLATWLALSSLFLSKFSAPALMPMGLLLLAIRLGNPAPLLIGRKPNREIHGRVRQLVIFVALSCLLMIAVALSIWASFGFRYAMINPSLDTPETSVPWQEVETTSSLVNHAVTIARDYHLLPEAYLYGFAYVIRTSEGYNSFFNGECRRYGWLSFFPYCFAVKTPLEFLAILAAAVGALWRGHRSVKGHLTDEQESRPGILYRLAPLLVLFATYWAFALATHLNTGHRYLLPIYPPLFIIAGAAVWWFRPPANRQMNAVDLPGQAPSVLATTMRIVVAVAVVLSAVEGIWLWPHYLAYFNPLDGGPRTAYRHLVDSSLDWSQDLKGLKRWLDTHPADASDERRLYFAFFGGAPPEFYGIHAQRLPSFPDRWQPRVPEPLTSGTYMISATMLQCVMLPYSGRWNESYEKQYDLVRAKVQSALERLQTPAGQQALLAEAPQETWTRLFWAYENLRFSRLASFLRTREPDDEVGYSILIYRLTDDDLAQALDGPPVELLERPEIESEDLRLGRSAGHEP